MFDFCRIIKITGPFFPLNTLPFLIRFLLLHLSYLSPLSAERKNRCVELKSRKDHNARSCEEAICKFKNFIKKRLDNGSTMMCVVYFHAILQDNHYKIVVFFSLETHTNQPDPRGECERDEIWLSVLVSHTNDSRQMLRQIMSCYFLLFHISHVTRERTMSRLNGLGWAKLWKFKGCWIIDNLWD